MLLVRPAQAQLRGHGGPVRALAISPDGYDGDLRAASISPAIRWSLARNAAEQVLRFHDGAVNAVAMLPGRPHRHRRRGRPHRDLAAGRAPADRRCSKATPRRSSALAVSPDGTTLASASWDRTIRLWPLEGGEPRVLEGHQQNVNGVAFTPDGKALVSAGYDATLRIWPLDGGAPTVVTLPTPLNSVAVAPDGEIVAGGRRRQGVFPVAAGEPQRRDRSRRAPIIAVAISGDGALIAAAGIRGSVAIIDRARASSNARWSGRACRSGRSRSFPTAARCSPAAPTA